MELNEMPTPYKINCLLFAYLRKSSRIFFVSNYLLNLVPNHATNLVQTRYLQAEKNRD